jgi:hypothetical protein
MMGPRSSSSVCAALIAAAASSLACEGKQFDAQRRITSTVAIGAGDTTLIIDSIVPIEVHAVPSQKNALAVLDATLTASTSTRAKNLIAAYEVKIDTAMISGSMMTAPRITVPPVRDAALGGTLVVTIPSNIGLDVSERGSTALFDRIGGPITVVSASSIRATGVERDLMAAVTSGNAIIDVSSGSPKVFVSVDRGDIDVLLPAGANVVIDAVVTVQGQVLPAYPGLPQLTVTPGETYHAALGANGAPVELSTNVGNIVIEQRR